MTSARSTSLPTALVRLTHKPLAIALLIAVMATHQGSAVGQGSAASGSVAPSADSSAYARAGKQLRRELKDIYATLRRTHDLGSPTRGHDVTDTVLKYIPAGTSFTDAEAILVAAGFRVDPRPGDVVNPYRPLEPQEPQLAKLPLGGWPLGHYVLVALTPRANDDYSVVTRVSAAILMAYS
jgi:hypothetical protein